MSRTIIDLRENSTGPIVVEDLEASRDPGEEPWIFAQPFPGGKECSDETIGKWLVRSSRLLCRQGIPLETVLESHSGQVMGSPMAGVVSLEEIAEYVEAGYANQRAMQPDFDECIGGLISEDKDDPILIQRIEDPFSKSLEEWRESSAQVKGNDREFDEYLVIRYRIKPWNEVSYRESIPFFVGAEHQSDNEQFYFRAMTEESASILEEIGENPFDEAYEGDALRALVIEDRKGAEQVRYVEGWFAASEMSVAPALLFAAITGADLDTIEKRRKAKLPGGLSLDGPGRSLLYLQPWRG